MEDVTLLEATGDESGAGVLVGDGRTVGEGVSGQEEVDGSFFGRGSGANSGRGLGVGFAFLGLAFGVDLGLGFGLTPGEDFGVGLVVASNPVILGVGVTVGENSSSSTDFNFLGDGDAVGVRRGEILGVTPGIALVLVTAPGLDFGTGEVSFFLGEPAGLDLGISSGIDSKLPRFELEIFLGVGVGVPDCLNFLGVGVTLNASDERPNIKLKISARNRIPICDMW